MATIAKAISAVILAIAAFVGVGTVEARGAIESHDAFRWTALDNGVWTYDYDLDSETDGLIYTDGDCATAGTFEGGYRIEAGDECMRKTELAQRILQFAEDDGADMYMTE